ncbi:MAG: glycosyltransferase, partial [Chloroflexi bacterium]|nr:glycosyltransferase [Chloroflexota bacterium]
FYLFISVYKFYLIYNALGHSLEIGITPEELGRLDEQDLPVYTILVPLYKETEVLPTLVAAMGRLDYPKAKLDVKLLLEEDDIDTIRVARASRLPSHFQIVVVPNGRPKGKQKACNYGLLHARGTYTVIFDAEDVPDPDQLKKVVVAFRKAGPQLGCVQCKLNYYNQDQNLLTRWFTSEYSMWFDLFLPGLDATGAPIPLGGTSNHFPTIVLQELGAWDPYNVTEDADLGIRLFKKGYNTAVVDSTTYEEANSDVFNWIRQRSRWVKGYIQTWLVHMRNPVALYRAVGFKAFLSIQMTIGGTFFTFLVNPVFWALTVIWFLIHWEIIDELFPGPIFYIGSIMLFVGNFTFTYASMMGCLYRGYYPLIKYNMIIVLYWYLMSFAAWKGFLQLFRNPFYWEKTVHGLYRGPVVPGGQGPGHAPERTGRRPRLVAAGPEPINLGRAAPVRPGVRVVEGRAVELWRWEELTLFLLVTVIGSAVGIWANAGLHLYQSDALSRTYSAVQVMFGQEPKLANIGFIWPPLPTFVQLPLALFLPDLAFRGGIAPITSAIGAGVSLVLLNRILVLYAPGRAFRYMLLIMYQTNPMVVYLTICGLSEMIFLMFVLLGWLAFQRLTFEEPLAYAQSGVMGAAAAGAVLSRYEGAVFGMTMGGLLMIMTYFQKRPLRWAVTEGLTISYAAPLGYAVALWIFFNEMIMHNAFFFLVGKGSNREVAAFWLNSHPSLQALVGNLQASTVYLLRAAWDVYPAFLVIVPLAMLFSLVKRDLFLLSLLGAALSFPAVQWVFYMGGQSLGWLRYFVYDVPFGIMLLAYLVRPRYFRILDTMPRFVTGFLVAMMLLASNVFSWYGLNDPAMISADEQKYLTSLASRTPWLTDVGTGSLQHWNIGAYLRDNILDPDPKVRILVDDQEATNIILFSGRPSRFVVPSSSMFSPLLRAPIGKVDYLLVPETVQLGVNLILAANPNLYQEGAPFVSLERAFDGPPGNRWRLFKVIQPRDDLAPVRPQESRG